MLAMVILFASETRWLPQGKSKVNGAMAVLWTHPLLFSVRNINTLIQERPGLYREVLHLPGPRRRHPLHGAKDKAHDLEVERQRHYFFPHC